MSPGALADGALGAQRMMDALRFERDGRDWPNREASRFLSAGGVEWHLQRLGDGPPLLLLHGAGAATHTWRALAPLLAERFSVIAPDLPGHGFTSLPSSNRMSLDAMADALGSLLAELGESPTLVLGHSAGAAIAARMALDGRLSPRAIVSINGALLPLNGLAGHLFSPVARLLSALQFVPSIVTRAAAAPGAVERLVRNTGSTLEPRGIALYRRLACSHRHVSATLTMMARWDLRALERDLPALRVPLVLLVGSNDLAVPPSEAERVQQLLPQAERRTIEGLGHLAHEERPDRIHDIVIQLANHHGVLADGDDTGTQAPRCE